MTPCGAAEKAGFEGRFEQNAPVDNFKPGEQSPRRGSPSPLADPPFTIREHRRIGLLTRSLRPMMTERVFHRVLCVLDPGSPSGNRPTVNQRLLGESGIRVSAVALGTWAMGGDVAVWGHTDDRESMAAIQQALDCGINLIDTAPIYGDGHAEEIVGKAVSGRRDEVVIATKCGLVPPERDGDLPRRDLSATRIQRECEASLRRLRVEVIDIYLCHWPDPETPVRETMEALMTLRDQGKIRAIGLSNFGCERLAAAREFGSIHCLQPPFSMLNRRAADDLLPYCQEHQIGVLCYGPLAKGLLTGKFERDAKFDDLRNQDPDFNGARFQGNLDIVDELKKVAIKYDKTVAQLAINWTATFPGIAAPIFGAKRPSQVRENVGGIGWEISREDRDRIDQILGGPPGAI